MASYKRHVFNVIGGAIAETFGPVLSTTVLKELRIHLSAAPTTAGSFTVRLDSADGAAYDVLVYSIDPSTASTTDVFNNDLELLLVPGDALDVAYANADGRTIGVQMIFE